jgi:D-amino-acid dehydrogenase
VSTTVIIGGGAIGLCCAHALAQRGERVVVLDGGKAGAASAANAGWVVPTFSGPLPAPGVVRTVFSSMFRRDSPFYLNPAVLPELAAWLWTFWRRSTPRDFSRGLEALAALNRGTMTQYDALARDGVAFEMHRLGVLFVFLHAASAHHLLEDLEHLAPYGYGRPAVLSHKDLRDLEPALGPEVSAGYLVERERHLRPESLLEGLRRRLQALGVDLRFGAEATGVRVRHRAATAVVAGDEHIWGDRFVIAAGAWSGRVARRCGFHIPVQAAKGYSVTAPAASPFFRRPLYLSEARIVCSPFQGATRIAGWLELSGLNPAADARRVGAMARLATRYVPGWRPAQEDRRAGLRPLMPDGLPVIGQAPRLENVYVATGHGMLGITLAPVTGAVIADLITKGRAGEDLAPFSPARFERSRP